MLNSFTSTRPQSAPEQVFQFLSRLDVLGIRLAHGLLWVRPLAHPQQPYEAGSYPFREWKRKHWALLQGFLCVTSSLQGWPSYHGWKKPFIFPVSGSGAFQRCEVPSPTNADSTSCTEPALPGPQPPQVSASSCARGTPPGPSGLSCAERLQSDRPET